MKKCTKCGVVKPLAVFSVKANGKAHSWCKGCCNESVRRISRTKEGVVTKIYSAQKFKSIKRGHVPPLYTKQELKDWLFSQENFHVIHLEWVSSNYNTDLKPSVDRLDDYKPYSFDNIRLVTWKENRTKSHSDTFNGKNRKLLTGVIRSDGVKFYSTRQAGRETETSHQGISSCCSGKQKTAGGYGWRYADC